MRQSVESSMDREDVTASSMDREDVTAATNDGAGSDGGIGDADRDAFL